MKPLRCAVIGTGHLGRIHARLLQQIEDVELVAIVDPDSTARQAVAETCGVPALADVAEIQDCLDAAVVATPTRHHHAVTMDLLSRGVHCLVEKPITESVSEAEELIQTADRQGAVLAVGHVERFNPAVAAAAPHIDDPKYITGSRAGTYTFRSTDVSVVLDLMIHDIDIVLSLVGSPVVDVQALGVSVFGPHEDMVQARLTFANGCIADLVASRTSPQPARQMHVFGQNGYAGIDFATRTATVISPSDAVKGGWIDVHGLSDAQKDDIKENLFRTVLPSQEIAPGEANPLLDEQRDFVASIRAGGSPRVSGVQACQALAAAQQVLDSVARHQWDATPTGRVGPDFKVTPHVLQGPHWQRQVAPEAAPVRKAG